MGAQLRFPGLGFSRGGIVPQAHQNFTLLQRDTVDAMGGASHQSDEVGVLNLSCCCMALAGGTI